MFKRLYTPGPLSTSPTVKEKLNVDVGSRDEYFIQVIKDIRNDLLDVAGVAPGAFEAIIMQGSGTFGIEAVMTTMIPKTGKNFVIINGAYGRRIKTICEKLGIATTELYFAEDEIPDIQLIESVLVTQLDITHVSIIHCETTSGIINPIAEIGKLVRSYDKEYIVDAMSSFGAYEIDFEDACIDYLVSSSNKCIQGVPGFSFVIARRDLFLQKKGVASSLVLDLYDQWEALEKTGQFRFTPPTQSLLAYKQALDELKEEGGVSARGMRYKNNNEFLIAKMTEMGFTEYLGESKRGYIISSFYYPSHPNFKFETFYTLLSEKGFIIYPGKLTNADCFRIGNIGHLFLKDMEELVHAIEDVLKEMDVHL